MRAGRAKKATRTRTPIRPEVLAEWRSLGYVTVDEAAALLGVARSTLYNTISGKRFIEGRLMVPFRAEDPTSKPCRRLTYCKTSSTLWVLRAAVERVLETRRRKEEARATALARRPRAPSAAELAAGN